MEFKVESSEVFKSGVGARGPWTLYKLRLAGNPQEPTGFDVVNPGDTVTVSSSESKGKDGKTYQNLGYTKVAAPNTQATAPAQATTTGSPAIGDHYGQRILKMQVLIAEQMGIDKNQILNIVS